jgi:hypothetical protein
MNIKIIELTEEVDLIKNEKFLFESFVKKMPDEWIINNYTTIDNCRLKPIFPYSELKVLDIKANNNTLINMILNLNKNNLQLEKIGFKRELLKTDKNFCEGITFCSTGVSAELGSDFVSVFQKINELIFEKLKEYKIDVVYGTCFSFVKRFYERIGFKSIASIKKSSNEEFLLELEIK